MNIKSFLCSASVIGRKAKPDSFVSGSAYEKADAQIVLIGGSYRPKADPRYVEVRGNLLQGLTNNPYTADLTQLS